MENKISEILENIDNLEALNFEYHELLIANKNQETINKIKNLIKELYI